MRVEVRPAIAVARQRHGETNQGVAVERADDLAADALRDDEDTARDDIAVAITPDLELQDDATLEVFEGGKGLNADVGLRASRS